MKENLNKKALFVKAVASGAFFLVLISFVQGNELVLLLSRIDWLFLSLSFLLIPVMLSTSCLKWKVLLDASGKKNVGFLTLIRIYLIGYLFSNLLPSTVGGDVVRSYYAGELIQNQAYAAVSVFIERFTGILFLVILVMFSPLLHHGLYQSPFIYIPSIGALIVFLLILWVWKVKNPMVMPDRFMRMVFSGLRHLAVRFDSDLLHSFTRLLEGVHEGVAARLVKFKGELRTAYTSIRRDRQLFAVIIFLTVFFYFLTWVNVYISFRAFGVRPDFWAVSALVPTILFVAHVPLTLLGNLGFFESVFVFYFLLIQIPASQTLMMGLLLRVKMLVLGLIGLAVYISYRKGKDSSLRQLENDVSQSLEKLS